MKKVSDTLEPLYNENTNILILGSFPSEKSRELNFYYMNPRNRFFDVLSAILKVNVKDCTIEEKKAIFLKHRIGLFDVIQSCTIVGSSDASIRDVKVNDIEDILANCNIEKIILNGNQAYTLFKKYFPKLLPLAIPLPSTSPANAQYNLNQLIEVWRKAFHENDSLEMKKKA